MKARRKRFSVLNTRSVTSRRQLLPVHAQEKKGGRKQRGPEHDPRPTEEGTHKKETPLKKRIRVPERKTHGGRRARPCYPAVRLLLSAPPAEVADIGRLVRLEGVALVEVGEQADHLILRRHVIAEALADRLPDILHGAFAVHEAHNKISLPGKPVKVTGGIVLEDVPIPAPVNVVMELRVTAKTGSQFRDPVPGLAEKAFLDTVIFQGRHDQNQSLSQLRSFSVQMDISFCRSTDIFPMPSIPGLSVLAALSRPASTRKQFFPSRAVEMGVILRTTKPKVSGSAEKHEDAPLALPHVRYFGLVHLKDETVARKRRDLEQDVPLLHGGAQFLAEIAAQEETVEGSAYGGPLQLDFRQVELRDDLIELGLDDIGLGPVVKCHGLLVLPQELVFLTGQVRLFQTQIALIEGAEHASLLHRVSVARACVPDVPFERRRDSTTHRAFKTRVCSDPVFAGREAEKNDQRDSEEEEKLCPGMAGADQPLHSPLRRAVHLPDKGKALDPLHFQGRGCKGEDTLADIHVIHAKRRLSGSLQRKGAVITPIAVKGDGEHRLHPVLAGKFFVVPYDEGSRILGRGVDDFRALKNRFVHDRAEGPYEARPLVEKGAVGYGLDADVLLLHKTKAHPVAQETRGDAGDEGHACLVEVFLGKDPGEQVYGCTEAGGDHPVFPRLPPAEKKLQQGYRPIGDGP